MRDLREYSDLNKLIHNQRLNSQPFTQQRADYLISRKLISRELAEESLKYYQIANEIYPGQCDLQLYTERKAEYQMARNSNYVIKYLLRMSIRFDNLTVTNSENESIVIRDLFFYLDFIYQDERFRVSKMGGNRATFSYNEYAVNYRHSHLENCELQGVQPILRFCFGEGDLPRIQLQFNQTLPNNTEGISREDIFRMLLLNIEPYLSWESLEGGPHKRMSAIFEKASMYNSELLNKMILTEYIYRIFNNQVLKSLLDCDIVLRSHRYMVSDNKRLNDSLVKIVETGFSNSEQRRLLFKKGSDNILYAESRNNRKKINISPYPIMFQQKKFYLTVYNEDVAQICDPNYYIHPKLKQWIKTKIENDINYQSLYADITKRFQNKVASGQEY